MLSEREIEKITAFINAKAMPDAEWRKYAELHLEVLLEQLIDEGKRNVALEDRVSEMKSKIDQLLSNFKREIKNL